MADQPKRVLYIYHKLLTGRKYTSFELKDMIAENLDNTVSLRTIQRDLKILYESVPSVTMFEKGGETLWGIEKEYRNPMGSIRVQSNELLSYYVLKAHLKAFQGTYIEEDLKELTEKIEDIAPSNIILEDALFWDQNIGQFDYTQYAPQIKAIINYIVEKEVLNVEYNTSGLGKINSLKVVFRTIFTYNGFLYVIAYVPNHNTDIALTIHNIESMVTVKEKSFTLPPFNFKEWTKNRFGVYYGKPEFIKLLIKKEFNKFFENRKWHQTQNTYLDDDGNLILEMKAPVTIDLISWIMSWSYVIEVLKPKKLRQDIIKTVKLMLYNYQENDFIEDDEVEDEN